MTAAQSNLTLDLFNQITAMEARLGFYSNEIRRLEARLEILETRTSTDDYVKSTELRRHIPQFQSICESHRLSLLRTLRDNGLLKEGMHYVNIGKGKRPVFMYRPALTRDALELYYSSSFKVS